MRKVICILFFLMSVSISGYSQSWEILNAAASRLMDEGHPGAAHSLFQAGMDLLPPSDSVHRSILFQNLASSSYALGSYSDALGYLMRAEKEGGPLEGKRAASLLNTRANLLQQLGRLDEAENDFSRALKLARGTRDEASIQLNLSDLQLKKGLPYEAASNALFALFKTTDPLDSLIAFRLLYRSASLNDSSEEVAVFQEKANDILKRRFPSDAYQQLLQLTTEAYTNEIAGNYSTALSLYEKALPGWISLRGYDNPETISILYGIAKTALGHGEYDRALEAYLEYLSHKLSFLRSEAMRLGQDDLRSFWNTSREGIVDAPLYVNVATQKRPEALGNLLNAVMLSKGFNQETVKSFRTQVALAGDSLLDSLYTAFRESHSDLSNFDREQSEMIAREMTVLLSKKGLSPSVFFMPSWERSANRLSVKSVAVEFTCGQHPEDSVVNGAFVYKKGDRCPVFVPLPSYEPLTPGIPAGRDTLSLLYSKIWLPLEPYIQKADTVFFAPAGDGHLLPLEALTDTNGVPFRNRHKAVIRLVSTADIPNIQIHPRIGEYILFGDMDYSVPKDGRAVGFLDNLSELEGSKREMDSLSLMLTLLPHQVFRRENATEEAFRSLKFNPNEPIVLHFSTHGAFFSYPTALNMMFYDDNYSRDVLKENPMLRTVLFMTGAYDQWLAKHHNPLEDATITAQEISEMDLRGISLAVLAACETAIGDSSPEGVFGFPYAFKLAGAKATIASLWSVNDDASCQMMIHFYRELIQGESPDEALKRASEAIRAQPRYKDPFYWAPFVVVR